MNTHVEFRTVQLLCSRICHDLIGPVGAINTAIELMEDEDGGALDAEALRVLAKSAAEASRKLAFFRAVFGLGGDSDAPVQASDLMDLTNGLLGSSKVTVQWDENIPATLPGGAGKILMLLIFLGSEALPRGGRASARVQSFSDGLAVACIAEGEGAVLNPEIGAVLKAALPPGEMTARGIPAYVLSLLAREHGAKIEVSTPQSGQVALAVLFSDELDGEAGLD